MVDKTREVRANQRLITERCFAVLVWIAGILGIFIPLYIITFITINGAPILSWAFLTLPPAGFPLGTGGGIGPAILGSLALITIGLSFSAPLSILAAIFSSQYCTSHNFLVFVRFFAEVLASVPSIIYGLFGYALLVVFFDLKIFFLHLKLITKICQFEFFSNISQYFRVCPTEKSTKKIVDSFLVKNQHDATRPQHALLIAHQTIGRRIKERCFK